MSLHLESRFLAAVDRAQAAILSERSLEISSAFAALRSAGDKLLAVSPTAETHELIVEKTRAILSAGDRFFARPGRACRRQVN